MNQNYTPPTLNDLNNASTRMDMLANDLDFYRRIDGLSEADKEEIWDIVLKLTGYSAALSRIKMLSE